MRLTLEAHSDSEWLEVQRLPSMAWGALLTRIAHAHAHAFFIYNEYVFVYGDFQVPTDGVLDISSLLTCEPEQWLDKAKMKQLTLTLIYLKLY